MRHILLRLVPMAFACIASQGQQQELRFEVASIKPGTPLNRVGRPRGGPGTTDPGMFTCTSCDLALLISMAYGPLSSGQFQASNYLNSLRSTFYIVAKVPPGATRQEFQMMMRNLLVERFKVAAHRELRVMPVYELTATKDGPKFNPAKPAEPNNDELPDVESVEMPKRADVYKRQMFRLRHYPPRTVPPSLLCLLGLVGKLAEDPGRSTGLLP